MTNDANGVITELASNGHVVRQEGSGGGDRLKRSFDALMARTEHPDRQRRFLALYDAAFRLAEEFLQRRGWTYGSRSPHVAFKRLFPLFFQTARVDPAQLADIVRERHRVKKYADQPSFESETVLRDWISLGRREIGW